mmetsp:Transcript_13142/g.21332  ORF Transcript_13142/g.21332 Transcript_13142/m.21332 type:complete len:131 (+) Transcript_13142:143-535(+)|eukprot:CAMPEP_0203766290 /NCGR_PEP_ID=MMETSP0099_2-20121227/330_1 /ASSEMBLY_ACC=CAM_ASM_000209 /TAXON_ID=96639 /ORGANISM=" , Strain NY0313808BC1" /LENGTH=130 /DNA_ID=CAMNT_0050662613 /DNA_START=222 /DNA_END=614 /DNA_ORIENTATION=+
MGRPAEAKDEGKSDDESKQVDENENENDIKLHAQNLVQKCIVRALEGKVFKAELVSRWVDYINQECIDELAKVSSDQKYVASSIVYQSSEGAGLSFASSMFWDQGTDWSLNVSWENESVGCIVNVFGMAL